MASEPLGDARTSTHGPIEELTLGFPDADVEEMRRRLRNARWPGDYANEDWYWGVERGWLQEMAAYWADTFDLDAQLLEMNAYAQRRVVIDDVPVHFTHVEGRGPDPLPLVLTHGWPWTFWDYRDVIGPLSDPGAHGGDPADAFTLVIPSLPGYGFSSPLRVTGMSTTRVAQLWAVLMHDVLGYEQYAAAGGDWGGRVTGELGIARPDRVVGIYLTLTLLPGVNRLTIPPEAWAEDEAWMLERADEALPLILPHVIAHRNDPQTLAYAMADSPIGTGAYLWQRRRNWSDCDGDVVGLFGRDDLCTLASLYWLTDTMGTSMRFYRDNQEPGSTDRVEVPTGFGVAPRDNTFMPRSMAEERANVQRWHVFPRGGHFAPAEIPELVVDELRTFFRPLRPADQPR